jgi:signal peptidase II
MIWMAEVALVLTLARWVPSFQSVWGAAGLGLVLGGATGNLLDRIWRRGVIDFIDLRVWPVFNLADLAIVAGVLLEVALVL